MDRYDGAGDGGALYGSSVTSYHIEFTRIPYFFGSVFAGAFKPDAFFGGVFGTVLAQGVKRGLMSNEAGQGTITMSAAAADAKHPCEQGVIASLGRFFLIPS